MFDEQKLIENGVKDTQVNSVENKLSVALAQDEPDVGHLLEMVGYKSRAEVHAVRDVRHSHWVRRPREKFQDQPAVFLREGFQPLA